MSGKCLHSRGQIRSARAELRQRHLGYDRSLKARALAWCGGEPWVRVGDWLKSWDVLETAHFLEGTLPRSEPILDLGAFGSEILFVLTRMGFSHLHGIDLDPRLEEMKSLIRAQLTVADFYATQYEAERFSAVTAISVIEHGYHEPELFAEVSRVLRSGGYFIASFDFWPEKVDTSGMDLFGMSWRIFSLPEVQSMLACAREYGLLPVGEVDLEVARPVIHWGGKDYTFAWVVLTKNG